MQGCDKRAVVLRKVKLLEEINDYHIEMKLCTRHKNHFKQGEALVGINLKNYGKETLLGEGKDKDRKRIVNESLDYIRKQAKEAGYENSMEVLIKAAQHFAKTGDAKFLFGYYFGQLFGLSSFRDFPSIDVNRRQKAEQIRSQMNLKQLYALRVHPDTSHELVDVCRCGHESIMHDYGPPRGACVTCLCPRYEFEQKMTQAEASDLKSLIYRELQKS